MSVENKISERAQKVLQLMKDLAGEGLEIWIRQATLAEHFGCSRTTIWRAIKQLREAGLIIDLNKRHEHRYKIYQISVSKPKTDQAEIEELLTQYEEIWQKGYPYFGTPKRPTLRKWVFDVALMGKPFRERMGQNLQEWVESCLNTTENWAVEYANEQLALVRARRNSIGGLQSLV
ncbi:MAG: HTH domain-containing protein [Myxococcaceae bacterium]